MTKKIQTTEPKKSSDWYKTLLSIAASVMMTIILSLLQNSYIKGQMENRVSNLEMSVKELRDANVNFVNKDGAQLDMIHGLDKGITELKISSKYQEELLNELKRIVSKKNR